MDTIWYRNPSMSEVIGRCGEDKKPNDHAEPTKKSNANKTNINSQGFTLSVNPNNY